MSENERIKRRINQEALRERVYGRLGFNPHPGQKAITYSPARHRVASCGRRFGKSFVGGHELTVEAMKARLLLPQLIEADRRREFWIVGPNYTDAEKEFRVLYNDLAKLGAPFDKPGTYNNPHDGDMQISLYDGRFIVIAKSAQYPERLVGEGLNGVIMAEAAKQRERTWTKYIRPMLADFNGWSLHTSTPEGKNWFYENWMKGQSQHEPDWESWRMPSWRNPYVYPMGASQRSVEVVHEMAKQGIPITDQVLAKLGIDPEVGALLRDLTQETFSQEIAAEFNEFVGRVFKDFDEEIHVRDLAFDPALPVYAASDYGFSNPFVWLLVQIDPYDGTVLVLDEMYESGMTIDEIGDEIITRQLNPGGLRTFYPDPASPGDTLALEKKLRIKGARGTGGDLDTRLRLIRAALKVRNQQLPEGDPLRKPKLLINRKCTNTIREFGAYRYPKTVSELRANPTNSPEKPLKKDDHTPEALGRLFAGMFMTPERGQSRTSAAQYA